MTVTRSAGGLERAKTRKKYANQDDHIHLQKAGRGLERHAVMALIEQHQERPSGLHGCGAQGCDLSLNRYKELIHEKVEFRPPLEILAELRAIEQEILQGIEELEGMLR